MRVSVLRLCGLSNPRLINIPVISWAAAFLMCLMSSQASAQHLPTTYVVVANDGVNTDRFQDPEVAARTSIDRANAKITNNTLNIFHHIEYQDLPTSQTWRIYYLFKRPDGSIDGPYQYGSSVQRIFVCDPTPKPGPPGYPISTIGLPRIATGNPQTYAAGCPAPQVDGDKNCDLSDCDGNPINAGMLRKVQVERDYSAGSSRDDLRFERTYSSNGFTTDAMRPYQILGARWRHNFDQRVVLYETSSKSTAAVLRPNGTVLKFTLTSGVWTPDPDVVDTLQRLTDSGGNPTGWTYTTENDVETYDVDGRLVLKAFRAGTSQTLTYSTGTTSPSVAPVPGLLISVADNFGHSLQFVYDSNKRIQSVTDSSGGVYAFTYDAAQNLTGIPPLPLTPS